MFLLGYMPLLSEMLLTDRYAWVLPDCRTVPGEVDYAAGGVLEDVGLWEDPSLGDYEQLGG